MNINAFAQLFAIGLIVISGPAVIGYLSYKKVL